MLISLVLLVGYFEISNSDNYSNSWLIKGNLTKDDLNRITDKLGFTVIGKLPTGLTVLSRNDVQKRSKHKAFYHTKLLLSDEKIEFVEQEKWFAVDQRQNIPYPPRDAKWTQMWYINEMKNVSMGVVQTWKSNFSGKGISIAIVDDGVDYTHKDLKERYDSKHSYDFYDDDRDPSPAGTSSRHGTKCAGIALASANNICVIGVAFRSSLVAIRMIGAFGVLKSSQARALMTDGVHVFSNSWGGTDHSFDGPSKETQDALKYGVTKLRDSKGAIYVFAAGNGGFDDNCNTDGYINSIYTIAINAVAINNDYPGYAEPCTAVLASTYSGNGGATSDVSTTDLGQGCVSDFRGTSAATPLAAGVLALLLEANPNLNWRDVQELIVRTSRSDVLAKNGDFKVNGAGLKVSDWFGFGLLDAFKLVSEAKTWKNLPPQHTCSSEFKTENKKIGANFVSYIATDGCNDTAHCVNSIEHVEIQVIFSYTVRGYIEAVLESPSGTTSKLLAARNSDRVQNGKIDWTYMSVQHWRESSVGQWKLKMAVKVAGEEGKLIGWKMKLYGTGIGCTKEEKEQQRRKPESNTKSYIIGFTIGGCSLIGIVAVLVVFICKRCKKKTVSVVKEVLSKEGSQIQHQTNNGNAVINNEINTNNEINSTSPKAED